MIQAQEYPAMHDPCATCGHPHNAHKGLGVKVEGQESVRKHVCLPVTREVCPCHEFRPVTP